MRSDCEKQGALWHPAPIIPPLAPIAGIRVTVHLNGSRTASEPCWGYPSTMNGKPSRRVHHYTAEQARHDPSSAQVRDTITDTCCRKRSYQFRKLPATNTTVALAPGLGRLNALLGVPGKWETAFWSGDAGKWGPPCGKPNQYRVTPAGPSRRHAAGVGQVGQYQPCQENCAEGDPSQGFTDFHLQFSQRHSQHASGAKGQLGFRTHTPERRTR